MLHLEHEQRIAAEALIARHTVHKESYHQEFCGLDLIIDPGVFNPAYTNVTRMFEPFIGEGGQKVLDMFEGCGALGILSARNADWVVGVDLSPEAVACARKNGDRLIPGKSEHRVGNLWGGVAEGERFDFIIANPPLLPVDPQEGLEMAIADSVGMKLTTGFIQGLPSHLTDNGRALMSLSNTSAKIFGNPVRHFANVAAAVGLSTSLLVERDVKYEIYRIVEFRKT